MSLTRCAQNSTYLTQINIPTMPAILLLQFHFPHFNRCIGELERKERDYLFTQDSGEDPEGLRKRQKQREKEDLVTQSGKATDNLASISRQLAETVER